MLCSFSSLVIRNRHRVAMYFHAPCGVVLYCFVCKLYANKEKKIPFSKLQSRVELLSQITELLRSNCVLTVEVESQGRGCF